MFKSIYPIEEKLTRREKLVRGTAEEAKRQKMCLYTLREQELAFRWGPWIPTAFGLFLLKHGLKA